MNATSLPESLAGLPLTAVGVAVIRAVETERADPLYRDPFAQAFVDAAEREFLSPSAPPEAAQTWASMLRLAEVMQETRTIAVRAVDDRLLAAAEAGRTQIVLLGAGLDMYAFRLPWPRPVHIFEIDLPPLFEFKERVIAELGAQPLCARDIVPMDLRDDWATALLAKGFQPDIPTEWVDSAIGFLSSADSYRATQRMTELSASGSRAGFPVMTGDSFMKTMRSVPNVERLYPHAHARPELSGRAGALDRRAWLENLGWTTTTRTVSFAEMLASYGRMPPADTYADATSGTVTAIRR